MTRTLMSLIAAAGLLLFVGCNSADTMSHATPKAKPPTEAAKPADDRAPTSTAAKPVDKPEKPKADAPPKPSPEELKRRREEAAKRRREELAKRYPAEAAVWTDGFDRENPEWRAMEWGNPAVASIDKKDDNPCLKLKAGGGIKEKVAILKPIAMDISSRKQVLIDLYNESAAPVGVAVSITTDEWYESPIQQAKVGDNRGLRFDLTASNFKTKSTDWKYTAAIKQKDRPKFISILIYTDKPGDFYIDNVRMTK